MECLDTIRVSYGFDLVGNYLQSLSADHKVSFSKDLEFSKLKHSVNCFCGHNCTMFIVALKLVSIIWGCGGGYVFLIILQQTTSCTLPIYVCLRMSQEHF